MLKIFGIALGIAFVLSQIADHETKTTKITAQNLQYTQCINSPETKFQISYYKTKYNNVSDRQIAHIICDRKN